MTANTERVATLPTSNGQESARMDGELVRLLIPEEQISKEARENVLEALSTAFDGYLAFSTNVSWANRERNFKSSSATAVEILLEGSQPDGGVE